jgi:hypothetical protein
MPTRPEPTRPAGRRIPEIRTAAPTTRSPVTSHATAQATAPVAQASFGGFGFGGQTLAPATGTMDLQAEEQALIEMAAAVRAEIDQAPAVATAPEVEASPAYTAPAYAAPAYAAPAPVMAVPAPAPVASQMSAQTAAIAEAIARAPAAAAPRTAPSVSPFSGITARETFIPKAPVEPRMEMRAEPREIATENRYEPAAPVMGGPAPTQHAAPAAKQEPGRIRLFDRYRSLTAKPKVEEAAPAPQPQANVQRPGLNISMSPADRPVASHSEDELEIPAFLRRQAN